MSIPGSEEPRRPRRPSRLLEVDAWLDSALYALRNGIAKFWDRLSILSRRMQLTGFKRFLVEVLDEGFSIGVAGFVVLLALHALQPKRTP